MVSDNGARFPPAESIVGNDLRSELLRHFNKIWRSRFRQKEVKMLFV